MVSPKVWWSVVSHLESCSLGEARRNSHTTRFPPIHPSALPDTLAMHCGMLLLLSAVVALVPSVTGYYYYPCGRYNRYCGIGAYCYYGKCRCVYGYVGCPLVYCHEPSYYQCTMKSDPHFLGFAGAKANLNWPCKYRMTKVYHAIEGGGEPGSGFCSFEVFGYNEVINGRYFTRAVEITFAVGDLNGEFFTLFDIVKFDINQHGIRSTIFNLTEWGNETHIEWNGITVGCIYDPYYRLALFYVPQCGFAVKFRPFDPYFPTGPQPLVPTISVVVNNETIFGNSSLGTYPSSLCGETVNQGDDTNLYDDRADDLGLNDASQALLFDAINQHVEQVSLVPNFTEAVLQRSDQCQNSLNLFTECTFGNKVKAIRLCAVVLKRLALCCGPDVIAAFNKCVLAVCEDKAAGCAAYKDLLKLHYCGRGPRKVRRFCRSVEP